MCNLAAYLGPEPAAPRLIAMMDRQQGFAGGYYSGLATVAEGRLNHAKVVGDLDTLLRETPATALPGGVGIAHSRSPSGGDVAWGHPFVDNAGRLAYVANGALGTMTGAERQAALVSELEAAGHAFDSRSSETFSGYATGPSLGNGTRVHLSEVMVHLIAERLKALRDPALAMRQAYLDYPCEVVGLLVDADTPDRVVATRINQPLMVAQTGEATWLATTALAFPTEVAELAWPLPPLTTATVWPDRIELRPLRPAPARVSMAYAWPEGREAVLAVLADGQPHGFGDLTNAVGPLWSKGELAQRDLMAYEILRALAREGRLAFEDVQLPGMAEDTVATRTRVRLAG